MQMVYAKELSSTAPLSANQLRSGVIGVSTPSRQPALLSLNAIHGKPVNQRDGLYLKTEAALACLTNEESVLAYVEGAIQSLPASSENEAFACTPLDHNLCRLKGLAGDLQRPDVVNAVGDYERFKTVVAENVELLAKNCRDYVAKTVGESRTVDNGLSPSELETMQAFNHQVRMMKTVFKLPLTNGEVYLEPLPKQGQSLDDTDKGGMNKVFSGISYSGSQRPLYMRYMPYYLMSMHGPLFLHALSRPKQLSAVTTRPGPLTLPKQVARTFGVAEDTKVTYHSVSRFGETNQRDSNKSPQEKKPAGPPMKFYYSYEEEGLTKVLTMSRNQHFYVQLENRPKLEIPAGVIKNEKPVQGHYVMHDYTKQAYVYETAKVRHYLNQADHQKIIQHNAKLVDLNDPNSAVHATHTAGGSLDSVMNRLFNDLAVRSVTNKHYIVELLPEGHLDRMKLMEDMTTVLRPNFEREQQRIEDIRSQLFTQFADRKVTKDTIEDTCRQEAKLSFRTLVADRRSVLNRAIPQAAAIDLLKRATGTINESFEKMYATKSEEFAKAGAARALYTAKVEPFYTTFKTAMDKSGGYLNVATALEKVSPEASNTFVATVVQVTERMTKPGGFKDALNATYWGGVTQNLMDLNYGPEGIHAEGEYISRENLPKSSGEFIEYLAKNAKEMLSDPVQVANRLSKTFANFEFNVSPYYNLPWPNLYRSNDLLRAATPANVIRDPRTVKPVELPVTLSLDVDVVNNEGTPVECKVRLTGKKERENKNLPKPVTQNITNAPEMT